MKVGIIGSGVVGQTLAAGFVKHGHEVEIGTRDPAKLEDEANELHEVLGATDRPLNELSERELCPGSKALDAINASLR